MSSDPKRPRLRLTLKGTVIGVGSRPSKVVYLYGIQGTVISKEYKIFTVGEGAIEIEVQSQPDFVKTRIEKLNEKPPVDRNAEWFQYKLIVSLKPDTPAGKLRGNLVLATTSQLTPKLSFRVMGTVRPGITVDPNTVRLFLGNDGKTVASKLCRIKKHTAGKFKILKIQPSVEELVCEITEVTPGKIYQLDFEWTGALVNETRRETVMVETDDEIQQIEIPVIIAPKSF